MFFSKNRIGKYKKGYQQLIISKKFVHYWIKFKSKKESNVYNLKQFEKYLRTNGPKIAQRIFETEIIKSFTKIEIIFKCEYSYDYRDQQPASAEFKHYNTQILIYVRYLIDTLGSRLLEDPYSLHDKLVETIVPYFVHEATHLLNFQSEAVVNHVNRNVGRMDKAFLSMHKVYQLPKFSYWMEARKILYWDIASIVIEGHAMLAQNLEAGSTKFTLESWVHVKNNALSSAMYIRSAWKKVIRKLENVEFGTDWIKFDFEEVRKRTYVLGEHVIQTIVMFGEINSMDLLKLNHSKVLNMYVAACLKHGIAPLVTYNTSGILRIRPIIKELTDIRKKIQKECLEYEGLIKQLDELFSVFINIFTLNKSASNIKSIYTSLLNKIKINFMELRRHIKENEATYPLLQSSFPIIDTLISQIDSIDKIRNRRILGKNKFSPKLKKNIYINIMKLKDIFNEIKSHHLPK
ncbi:MAG: hypothetical protein ABIC04_02020 [Nanoarchaeota archaeon]